VEGERGYLMSGDGRRVAILQTETVTRMKFAGVTEELAALEGEGDLSLDYWQSVRTGSTSPGMACSPRTWTCSSKPSVWRKFSMTGFAAAAPQHLAQERAGAT
jgi:hypothetical protein